MVNKAICNQISDFAFDVHYSGVQVVDVVPVRAEEHVVGVLSLPVLQCTVGLMRQVQDVQQRWIRLRQYLNNVASWASAFLAYNEKEENLSIFLFSLGCGGRDSNSHRITPTTPSK